MGKKKVTQKVQEGTAQQTRRGRPRDLLKSPREKNVKKIKLENNSLSHQDQSGQSNVFTFKPVPIETPQTAAQQLFIQFFEKIEHRNGFVFVQAQRRKLMAESSQSGVKWQQKPKWKRQQQLSKVSVSIQALGIGKHSQTPQFISIASQIGYLFDSQPTQQLYRILARLWLICINKDQVDQLGFQVSSKQKQIKELAQDILSNKNNKYKFFSFNFSKQHTVSNINLRQQILILIGQMSKIFSQVIMNSKADQQKKVE